LELDLELSSHSSYNHCWWRLRSSLRTKSTGSSELKQVLQARRQRREKTLSTELDTNRSLEIQTIFLSSSQILI